MKLDGMLKKIFEGTPLLSLLFVSNLTLADGPYYPEASYDHKFHFVASFGLKNGGDAISEVNIVGTTEVVEKLRIGGFFHASVGIVAPIGEDSDFSVQATVGYLYDEISSNITVNDRISISRLTAEIIPFYNFGRQRIGLGAMAHFSPEVEAKIGLLRANDEFDDAVGVVLQYDIMYDQSISAGVRLDYIEYEIFGQKFDGPTIGIQTTYQF